MRKAEVQKKEKAEKREKKDQREKRQKHTRERCDGAQGPPEPEFQVLKNNTQENKKSHKPIK